MGQMTKLDWLDRLTFMEIEAICEREKRESDFLYLNVEFPIAEYEKVQVCNLFWFMMTRTRSHLITFLYSMQLHFMKKILKTWKCFLIPWLGLKLYGYQIMKLFW